MRKAISMAAVGGCALVLAAAAYGAVTPGLQVVSNDSGSTTVSYAQGTTDDPAQKIVFFVPADYLATFAQQPGETVGTATASAVAADLAGQTLALTGAVTVRRATDTLTAGGTLAAAATACTGSATHQSFWVADLSGSGQVLQLPIYVDYALSGPFASFASATLTTCPPAPDVPAGTAGRAPAGAKLTQLSLATADVFSVASGWYLWHSLTTPGTAGKANTAGNVEAQATDRVPPALTVKSKRVKKGVALSGRLTAGGKGLGGQTVTLTAGGKAVAKAKTNGSGGYAVVVKSAKGKVVATAKVAARTSACSGAFFAPATCSSSSFAAFTVRSSG
jgi:hypothetical protein